MYKKEELWNKSLFCLLFFSFSNHFHVLKRKHGADQWPEELFERDMIRS